MPYLGPVPRRAVWRIALMALAELVLATTPSAATSAGLDGAAAMGNASQSGQTMPQTHPDAPKIYKYLASGVPAFGDIPPRKGPYIVFRASCYACNLTSTINWHATKLHPKEYEQPIATAALQYGIDPALVRAVIHAESGFNAGAKSSKGALGLMQLMPSTARELGVADARNPSLNIRGGTQYLAGLLARFKNDISLAAAAYNAGPQAVEKHAGIPPDAETLVYVQRVKILHQRYKDSPDGG